MVALFLLAGCQLVFPLHDRPDAAAGDGDAMTAGDGGGGRDSVGSPAVACEVTEAPRFDVGLTFGHNFVPDVDGNRAVKELNGVIRYTEVSPNLSTEGGYTTLFDTLPANMVGVDAPALASTGDRMILRARLDTGVDALVESVRTGENTWSPPQLIELRDINDTVIGFASGQEPTQATDTQPRHMLVDTDGAFTEYVEIQPLVWRQLATTTAGSLGIPELRNASLTENGLRLVYLGQPAGGQLQRVYTYKRSTIDEPFTGAPTELYQNQVETESYPYLSNDCKLLWYVSAANQIREVGFQL
ncbi:MAG TPA: hypothetical protein VFQ53_04330 [Kofleriaceae bacterium]|nr:hypothetical protein [Kofleriaceae bacterium]